MQLHVCTGAGCTSGVEGVVCTDADPDGPSQKQKRVVVTGNLQCTALSQDDSQAQSDAIAPAEVSAPAGPTSARPSVVARLS